MINHQMIRVTLLTLRFCLGIIIIQCISNGVWANTPCHPLSLQTCALPFPSDYFTHKDSQSSTGITTLYTDDLFREHIIDQIPNDQGIAISDLFAGHSGFSPNSQVLFEMPSMPDMSTLPASGYSTTNNQTQYSVVALNVKTGEHMLINANISKYAAYSFFVKRANVIQVYPLKRWNFGEQYIVAIMNTVKQQNGENYPAVLNFNDIYDHQVGNEKLSSTYKDALTTLVDQGFELSNIINATVFTIKAKQDIVTPMLKTFNAVYENEHPIRHLRIKYKVFGSIGAIIKGQVRVDSYRKNNTGIVDFDKTPTPQWIPFLLTMPRLKRNQQAPVAIYGHPLAGFKEISVNALSNAKLGIATIGIDFSNHGSRIGLDNGYAILNILTASNIPKQIGMFTQPTLDFAALLKAIQSKLNHIDLFPKAWWTSYRGASIFNGDQLPDLDVNNISVQGSSLGGVLGLNFASIAPGIKGAYFHVSGVGLGHILSNSYLWDFLFSTLVPWGSSGAEGALIFSMMQQAFDYGDPANFIDFAKYPVEGRQTRPIAILAGANDHVVSNQSTTVLANILDIPIVGEQYFEMPGVRTNNDFENGHGIIQEKLPVIGIDFIDNGAAHIFTVITPRALSIQEHWIKQYILNQ